MPQSSPAQERIKVLWLIKGLGPGGAEQLLLLSAKVADHDAFDYRVAFIRPDKTHLIPEFQALGLHPTRLGSQHTGRLGWLADLRSLLADVDVLHSHSPVLASVARLLTLTLPPRGSARPGSPPNTTSGRATGCRPGWPTASPVCWTPTVGRSPSRCWPRCGGCAGSVAKC